METCKFCGYEHTIVTSTHDAVFHVVVIVKVCPQCRSILSINWEDD